MRNGILLFCLLMSGVFVNAQETVFGNVNNIGGFGGPMIEISQINGETIADVGGGGGLILDNFFIGGYGMGTSAPNITIDNENFDIQFRHGGLWFGYVANPYKVAHFYSSFRLGWGEANLLNGAGNKVFSDNVLSLSPELGVELNLTTWIRVGVTGGYRFVDGIDKLTNASPELANESFSGVFGNITFRFGGFGDWGNDDDDLDLDFDF